MIGYAIDERELHRIIGDRLPTTRNKDGTVRKNARIGWIERAKRETQRLKSEGFYSEGPSGEFWRELKSIFAEIQGDGKCAYCEKKLARRGNGSVVADVEHYRPKNGVVDWGTPYPIPTGGAAPTCYYALTFLPRNFLLACSVCNQDFKGNYFPIAGTRCLPGSIEADLRAEEPYLLHPLDPNEPDPEALIQFLGIIPVPIPSVDTDGYWRARVTIDLLGLTSGARLDLDIERAHVVTGLFIALQQAAAGNLHAVVAGTLTELNQNSLPHRNCARSFERLYRADPTKAEILAREAQRFISSQP